MHLPPPSLPPILLLYGERDVKSRPLCERALADGMVSRCVMVRGAGNEDAPVEGHATWITSVRNYLLESLNAG